MESLVSLSACNVDQAHNQRHHIPWISWIVPLVDESSSPGCPKLSAQSLRVELLGENAKMMRPSKWSGQWRVWLALQRRRLSKRVRLVQEIALRTKEEDLLHIPRRITTFDFVSVFVLLHGCDCIARVDDISWMSGGPPSICPQTQQ